MMLLVLQNFKLALLQMRTISGLFKMAKDQRLLTINGSPLTLFSGVESRGGGHLKVCNCGNWCRLIIRRV